MKKILTIFLSILLLLLMITGVNAAESDLAETGNTVVTAGDWVYERINNDTQWQLKEYIGVGGEVTVPGMVGKQLIVKLGDRCFANNTNVTKVITFSPLWTIGEYCFNDCTTLESIELNYAVIDIGIGAFAGTASLKDINLEFCEVTEIKPYTFLNSGIDEVALPDTCKKIGNYAFGQCSSLMKITIPRSVTEIHEDAFKGSDNVVIYCYTDSYAHQYAEANGIEYVLIDAPIAYTFILGDADGDGVVTILDATVVQRVLVQLTDDPDGMIELRAAVDGDELNITHATKIQRYLADFAVAEPIGTEVTRVIPAPTQG